MKKANLYHRMQFSTVASAKQRRVGVGPILRFDRFILVLELLGTKNE